MERLETYGQRTLAKRVKVGASDVARMGSQYLNPFAQHVLAHVEVTPRPDNRATALARQSDLHQTSLQDR